VDGLNGGSVLLMLDSGLLILIEGAIQTLFVIGGPAIVALVATHKGTALAVRLAVGALLTAAMAGVVAVALFGSAAEDTSGFRLGRVGPDGSVDALSLFARNEAVSPLWSSAASAVLLFPACTMHAHGETSRGRHLSYN
jgi:hypothetical protein